MKHSIFMLSVIFMLSSKAIEGIPYVDRSHLIDPTVQQETIEALSTSGLYAEFAKYPFEDVSNSDFSWKSALGGFVELVRFPGPASLFLESVIELIADPNSLITFNPRSFFWEEGLVFSTRTGSLLFQAGYRHRCKHDVENLRFYLYGNNLEQRSVIYDSISLLLAYDLLGTGRVSSKTQLSAALRNDVYVILLEESIYQPADTLDTPIMNRLPDLDLPDIETLIDTASIQVHWYLPFSENVGIRAMARGSIDLYGYDSGFFTRFLSLDHVSLDWYCEFGIVLRGTVSLSPFIALERQTDSLIHPYRSEKYLVYAGLKTYDPAWYR